MTIALSGCHRVKPQAPANRTNEDTTSQIASYINSRMVEEANKECALYVGRQSETYTLSDFCFWYCRNTRSGLPNLQKDDHVELFWETYRLDGSLIESAQRQTQVGQRDTFFAIDLLLEELSPGDEVTIVAPYYTAYGRDGNELVPPYTNCIIHITNILLQQ